MELRDYINILYNRKWVIVYTLAIVLAVTLIFTFLQAPVYESKVKILTEVSSASESVLGSFFSSALFDPDRYIQTQAEIIQTDTMAEAVERHLEYYYEQVTREQEAGGDVYIPDYIPTAADLKSMVSVTLEQNTSIFDIVVTGGDPLLTRDVAQAYAEEFIASRQLAAIKQISEARKEVWNRIQEVEEQIQEVADQISQYTPEDIPTELQAEAERAVNLWATLYEKYMTLRIAESLEQRGLEIIEPAKSGLKVSPRPMRNGILAFFLGLILGLGLAFLVEYLDDTLHTREDFEHYYDIPLVGEIPYIAAEELPDYHIIYMDKPRHPAVEGYRTLRTNLQFLNLEGDHHSILFTSSGPEEGKSTVMVNLGTALAEMGKKVLLVEADLRRPVLQKYFQTPPEKGITGVLSGTLALEDAIQTTLYANLFVLTAGVKPPNPAELVASEAMSELLEKVKGQADYVLVDSPPVLAASDALAMAPKVDGVLIMAKYGDANRDDAKRTIELLRKVEANLLGLVINNLELAKRYGYYHYYYYYSIPGEGEEETPPKSMLKRSKRKKGPPPSTI